MTDNQLRRIKKYINEMRLYNFDKTALNKLDKICSCIDMVNSILAYDYDLYQDANDILENEIQRACSYLKKYVEMLGKKQVVEIIQQQQLDIKEIKRNVYTDAEGCTYNSIVWYE